MSESNPTVLEKPTAAEIDYVLEQAQYGYESHLDWEQHFRAHGKCNIDGCAICAQARVLGDADFHGEQKKRYEIELRILRWAKEMLKEL